MTLSVLSVAYPFAPVRSDTAGGAEQVLALLDAALVEAGYGSVVVACEGSTPRGALLATPRANGLIDDRVREWAWERHRLAIELALDRWPIDVVHMHGIDFDGYLPPPGVPVLVTLHLPPEWYSPGALHAGRPGTYFNCVSASQRRRCPAGVNLLSDIENGVPLEPFPFKGGRRNFAVALGRICPEKGFHIALDAASAARVPLLIAGEVYAYEAHERYFRQEVLPRLDGRRFRFIGPVGGERKRRLLAAARCLLVPSLAPETSSLVAMEALACGTPVIAFPNGALAEIVEHGKTGFLVRDAGEMAAAIDAAGRIDPTVCRREAGKRFSAERMVQKYFERYFGLRSPDLEPRFGSEADCTPEWI